MWKIKSAFLVFCLMGLCSANTAKSKTPANGKQKDVKEKRDVVTPTPYAYEIPQKSFQTPINVQHAQQQQHQQQQHQLQQQKYTQVVESQHAAAQKVAPLEYPKEDLPQAIDEPSIQFHPTTFHAQSFGPDFESLYSQSLKNFDEHYGQNFHQPQYESFNHLPVVHYNGDYDKLNSAIVAIPGYTMKSAPVVSNIKAVPQYVYAAPASSYNYASYSYPSHAYPSQSYVHSYPQAIAAPSHNHYAHAQGFAQSPSAIFIPQAVASFASKVPAKTPDYALGTKGLSHYSTVAAAPVAPLNTHYVSHYSHNHPQTERPFKASSYLGSSQHGDSYSEQSIGPSKTYLPAKEHSYASHQQVPQQVEYQIQYVAAPSKNYLPAKEHQYPQYTAPVANNYHKVIYEQPKHTYIPPAAAAPSKNYLPAKTETPSNVYLPSKIERPTQQYLPAKVEKPSTSYLPPNNPYHSSAASPVHYQAHTSSHEYESAEYQAVASSQSGHK